MDETQLKSSQCRSLYLWLRIHMSHGIPDHSPRKPPKSSQNMRRQIASMLRRVQVLSYASAERSDPDPTTYQYLPGMLTRWTHTSLS